MFFECFYDPQDLHSFPTRRSSDLRTRRSRTRESAGSAWDGGAGTSASRAWRSRSEEHTSELQSRQYLVCRLLLEKKNSDARSNARQVLPVGRPVKTGSPCPGPEVG